MERCVENLWNFYNFSTFSERNANYTLVSTAKGMT